MNTKESATGKSEFFAAGKMDMGFEIGEGFVTGVCLLYLSRADQEHEYMIREKSVVKVDGRDLSACVQEAKDLAYQSAISRLDGAVITPAPAPTVQTAPVTQTTASLGLGSVLTGEEKSGAPVPKGDDIPPAGDETGPDDDSELSGRDDDEDNGEDSDVSDFDDGGADGEPEQGGVQRLDLAGLRPASNLLNNAPPAQAPAPANDADAAMQKALAMPITILGKLHASFGKTAGEILNSDPQCIVDFAHRYTGPKVEEKEALVMLYPEAVRRVQKAA